MIRVGNNERKRRKKDINYDKCKKLVGQMGKEIWCQGMSAASLQPGQSNIWMNTSENDVENIRKVYVTK